MTRYTKRTWAAAALAAVLWTLCLVAMALLGNL